MGSKPGAHQLFLKVWVRVEARLRFGGYPAGPSPKAISKRTMMETRIEALPVDREGRTYMTDVMIREHASIRDFFLRTRNSWYRDDNRNRYVLYPSIIVNRTPRQRETGQVR